MPDAGLVLWMAFARIHVIHFLLHFHLYGTHVFTIPLDSQQLLDWGEQTPSDKSKKNSSVIKIWYNLAYTMRWDDAFGTTTLHTLNWMKT